MLFAVAGPIPLRVWSSSTDAVLILILVVIFSDFEEELPVAELSFVKLSVVELSIMGLSIVDVSIMGLSIVELSIVELSIIDLSFSGDSAPDSPVAESSPFSSPATARYRTLDS